MRYTVVWWICNVTSEQLLPQLSGWDTVYESRRVLWSAGVHLPQYWCYPVDIYLVRHMASPKGIFSLTNSMKQNPPLKTNSNSVTLNWNFQPMILPEVYLLYVFMSPGKSMFCKNVEAGEPLLVTYSWLLNQLSAAIFYVWKPFFFHFQSEDAT
jgi:hypothetical protein